MGANNSGRGVGGSMVHYAGYAPRFHPSDFRIHSEDGVGVDWPIAYEELRPHYQLLESELPVAGEHWPWGDPHGYPHAPHPISGAAAHGWRGAMARRVSTCGWGRSRPRTGSSETARTASTAASACRVQGQREGQPATSRPCPTRWSTASRGAPTAWRCRSRSARPVGGRRDIRARRSAVVAARGRGRRHRLLDRDATVVAELDNGSTPPRPRKRPGSGCAHPRPHPRRGARRRLGLDQRIARPADQSVGRGGRTADCPCSNCYPGPVRDQLPGVSRRAAGVLPQPRPGREAGPQTPGTVGRHP